MAKTITKQTASQGQADKEPKIDLEEIIRAVQLLREGQVVAVPTETVYGLAADGLNPEAIARIFAVKDRPLFDPLILHVSTIEKARELCAQFPATAEKLAKAFWPGPLTLVLKKKKIVPDLATAGLPTVAVRVPAHPVMQALLKAFGGPLAAPSANRFGRISPTTATAVVHELGGRVPMILEGGPCRVGLESTIVSLLNKQPVLMRLGGVPREEIEKVIGPVKLAGAVEKNPQAPGQLKHHYAPQKPFRLFDSIEQLMKEDLSRTGFLAFGPVPKFNFGKVGQLSAKSDLTEAAANFFALLRELDESSVIKIVAMRLPDEGLGAAINERLERAAARAFSVQIDS
jgi:L-threonylcarbamoyladenylate synthase